MNDQRVFWCFAMPLRYLMRMQRVLIAMGVVAMAAAGGVQAAGVSVNQSPLIIQQPLPPNIVLMLDDSGSMNWDFMPDSSYISPFTLASLRNSSINGVYYNPSITYSPPVHQDGSSYPNASFPTAWRDGFNTSSGSTNIQFYSSPYINGYRYYEYTQVSSGGNYTYNGNSYNFVFAYTDPVTGNVKYVGQSCSGFSSSDCTTSAAAQQNVANWFSYYRTRILMAKSGLMNAFSSLNPAYRVGFASINGRSRSWIENNASPYYSFSTSTQSENRLSEVQSWGDGTTGTQKNKFWGWLVNESPSGSTPLRGALKAVGQYYQTAQPWQTSSGDTTEYSCRQSYTILTTDGFWNGGTPSGIGDADNQSGATLGTDYTNSDGNGYKEPGCDPTKDPSCAYVYKAQAPYSQSTSNPPTLADVAMYYWKNDLRTGTLNEVTGTPNDPAFWQHMTTFTIGLGFEPTGITPTGTTIQDIFSWARTGTTSIDTSQFSWPTPSSNSINNIADLAHAAVNGHGAFFSANDPVAFTSSLKSALAAVDNRLGAANSLSTTGTVLPTSTSTADLWRFQATFYTGQWTGTLTADKYDVATSKYVQQWIADNVMPAAADRNIWTVDDAWVAAGSQTSLAFKNTTKTTGGTTTVTLPNISTAEQNGLVYNDGSVSVSKTTMLDYLRGDTTYEQGNTGGVLRARKGKLGDIVSSTPVYVGDPNADLYDGTIFADAPSAYTDFAASEKGRTPLVYVAGNDGMLHAFRVEQGLLSNGNPDPSEPAGQEVYAYLPGAVLRQTGDARLSNLANPDYGVIDGVSGVQKVPHQYYNDGRATVQNVFFGGKWHTVLVGTTGRGPAKAIYALDITDPSVLIDPSKAAGALLWERSADDGQSGSDYIGEMVGQPVIALVKQGTTTSWAVFIGNGYNSQQDKAALLQFNIQTGALTVHTTDATTSNGLAEPGLEQPDVTTGVSTAAYAGDLYGNVWKFDLSSNNSAGTKIFTAKDAYGKPQPITSLIALTYDTNTDSTWALFGTGKYLADSDLNDNSVQTWYGLRVATKNTTTDPSTGNPIYPVVSSSSTRADLTQRSIVAEGTANDGSVIRATSQQTAPNDMNGKVGWYMDLLPKSNTPEGERIINRTQFIQGMAVVTTLIPKVNDPCNTFPSGALMIVDPYTGANFSTVLGDFNGDGSISTSGDATTVGGKLVPYNGKVFDKGPAGPVTGTINPDGTVSLDFNTVDGKIGSLGPINAASTAAKRVSWRELINQ